MRGGPAAVVWRGLRSRGSDGISAQRFVAHPDLRDRIPPAFMLRIAALSVAPRASVKSCSSSDCRKLGTF